MQKIVLCAFAAIALALAAPQQQPDHPAYIVHQHFDVHPDGYQFGYETSDGSSRQEQASLQPTGEEGHSALQVSGAYRYVAPDGLVYSVTYTADDKGFKPQEHVEQPQQ